jgi:hypothetical protein
MFSARRAAALVAVGLFLALPGAARANGDPASDYLLVRDSFLPFTSGIDKGAAERLDETLKAADKGDYKIKAAIIHAPTDLGTAFSLFRKPQRYAQFLGLELSFVYRGRLLVVMPNGYGYAVNGKPDPKANRVLARVTPPGADATNEVEAATRGSAARRSGRSPPRGLVGRRLRDARPDHDRCRGDGRHRCDRRNRALSPAAKGYSRGGLTDWPG